MLVFPGVFRGLLDAQASSITADCCSPRPTRWPTSVTEDELNPSYIVPSVFHPDVSKVVAEAVARAARAARP